MIDLYVGQAYVYFTRAIKHASIFVKPVMHGHKTCCLNCCLCRTSIYNPTTYFIRRYLFNSADIDKRMGSLKLICKNAIYSINYE